MASEYPESNLAILSVSTTSSSIYMVGQANYGGYVSDDFGITWREIEYRVNNDDIFWNTSLQLTATSLSPSPTIYLAGFDNLYRSNDDGATWSRIAHVGSNYNVADIVADPSNASTAYVCTGRRQVDHNGIKVWEGNGLYISNDSGGSWLPINNGLPNQGNETVCSKIAIDADNSARIYVAMNGQVFVSENRGENWKQLSVLPVDIDSVTTVAVYRQKVCIGTNENGVWCTLR